jgi:alkanesulfonate monooxygenase SsuD/methylene tetrahydromethanopterin reductase-like flavin-dependent oxidoreductase (luciferase family)
MEDILMNETGVSFGFLLPTREIVMAQDTPDCQQIIDLAERAEALGFDSVWVGDSILARPRLEALTTLAAVASRTQRVKLGTAVFLSALRHPVTLANETANLDMLSQGRLILGLGIATKSQPVMQEFTACGVNFSRRIGIFEEGVTIMRRLWNEPSVTFNGRHFQLQDVRLGLHPVQSSGIPIWLAGSVDQAYRRILRLADGWFPNPASAQTFTTGWNRLQTLAQEMGQDAQNLHRCVYTTLNINDHVAQAEDEMRSFIENYYGVAYETMVGRQSMCAGTVEHCITWLNDFIAAGAQTLVLRFGGPDQVGQLQRCARDVLPHVRQP